MKKTKIFNYFLSVFWLYEAIKYLFGYDEIFGIKSRVINIAFGLLALFLAYVSYRFSFFQPQKAKKGVKITPEENLQNTVFVMKKSWFLIPLVGVVNYFLITGSITAGYLEYLPSRVVLTATFPAACLFAGLIVGSNLIACKSKQKGK
jgi:TRAP-type uncharacterized transport system fused permease subunit